MAAQIAAADLDLVGGHVEDAFGRLVETVRRTFGDDRDAARLRLLELFEVDRPGRPAGVGGAYGAGAGAVLMLTTRPWRVPPVRRRRRFWAAGV